MANKKNQNTAQNCLLVHKIGLDPIIDKYVKKVLIGTFPGEESLCQHKYYANNNNLFWKIINEITKSNFDYKSKCFDEQKKFLLKNNIGLCDIIHECDKPQNNSSDKAIKNPIFLDLGSLLLKYNITNVKIYILGKGKATKWFNKYLKENNLSLDSESLPSTSSVNTRYKNNLIEIYSKILP